MCRREVDRVAAVLDAPPFLLGFGLGLSCSFTFSFLFSPAGSALGLVDEPVVLIPADVDTLIHTHFSGRNPHIVKVDIDSFDGPVLEAILDGCKENVNGDGLDADDTNDMPWMLIVEYSETTVGISSVAHWVDRAAVDADLVDASANTASGKTGRGSDKNATASAVSQYEHWCKAAVDGQNAEKTETRVNRQWSVLGASASYWIEMLRRKYGYRLWKIVGIDMVLVREDFWQLQLEDREEGASVRPGGVWGGPAAPTQYRTLRQQLSSSSSRSKEGEVQVHEEAQAQQSQSIEDFADDQDVDEMACFLTTPWHVRADIPRWQIQQWNLERDGNRLLGEMWAWFYGSSSLSSSNKNLSSTSSTTPNGHPAGAAIRPMGLTKTF